MEKRLYRSALVVAMAAGLVLTACDESGNPTGVEDDEVATITLTTPSANLEIGETTQIQVTARDADGEIVDEATFQYTSDSEGVAIVSNGGLVTAMGEGSATITVTSGDASRTLTITVDAAGAATIDLDQTDLALAAGDTITVSATVRDGDGEEMPDAQVTFASEDEGVVTVDAAGLVTAVGEGSTRLVVEADGITTFLDVEVEAATASAVTFTLPETTLVIGETMQAEVVALNQNGNPLPDGSVALTSDDETVVTIAPDGAVTAAGTGTTTLRATVGGRQATIAVIVEGSASTLEVLPETNTISNGRTFQLNVVLRDAAGNRLTLQRRGATFTSDDESVLTVDANGSVTAVGVGTATLTVTVEGLTDTSTITVI